VHRFPAIALELGIQYHQCISYADSDVLHQYARKEDVTALSAHLSAISSHQQELEDEMKALEKEREELIVKNSILIDMVSETDAALDKATEELDQEKLKVEALKWYAPVLAASTP
jgi:peptidoglycan hydrolase CwlO-like protein